MEVRGELDESLSFSFFVLLCFFDTTFWEEMATFVGRGLVQMET